MKPITVLQIISGFAVEGPLGGIERFGIELSQALNSGDVRPVVCGLWSYGTPYEEAWLAQLQGSGIRAFVASAWNEEHPYRSFWRAMSAMRARVERQVDVIHSHTQFGDVAALLLRRRLGARGILRTVHNEKEWARRPARRLLLTNLIYPLAFAVEIGVARQVVENLDGRPVARMRGRRARLIYNALNLQRFEGPKVDRGAKRNELGIPEDALLVGTIGRLTAQKGYDVLLHAAGVVLERLPGTYFIIAGSGDLDEPLRDLCRQLRLEERVRFLGQRQDVEELLGCMDVFVNSSLWEGLPTVIMESMAAGVPVVATAVAGNNELVRHNKTGLLVPPGSAEDLAEAIVTALTGPKGWRRRVTEQANSHVRKRFAIQSVAKEHETLYRSLLGQ